MKYMALCFFILFLRVAQAESVRSVRDEIIAQSYSREEVERILMASLSFPLTESESQSSLPLRAEPFTLNDPSEEKIAASSLPDIPTSPDPEFEWTPPNQSPKGLDLKVLQRIRRYYPTIRKFSRQFDVPTSLMEAVIYVESAGNPRATSNKGAMGLMQLMPQTASSLGVRHPYSPYENICGGSKLINLLRRYFNNDDFYVLWAYNAGINRVKQNVLPAETHDYIIKVKRIQHLIEKTGVGKDA